ncbi:IS66 family insertion sequence element accessory protein TnpB [Burkholderia thailandensis]|uniref:IS66 family insertion sequence element accessory protein TnpB n=1 Tax=Burkholderia thailandensis TaxID=57975 RepID=UPI0039C8B49C
MNSLVTLVEQSMQLDPLARAVFAFHNRKRDRVKLLLYDRAGFWLLLKRLEADRFVVAPPSASRDRTDGRAASPAARRRRYRRHASPPRAAVLLHELKWGIAAVAGKQRRL